MQEENVFKLILNCKEYLIPSDFPSFNDVDSYVHSMLVTKGKYIVKSDISEIVLQSFISHWVDNETPNLRFDNIREYELLSEEFDRMKATISLFRSKISNLNCSYLQRKNTELNAIAESSNYKLNKENRNFHLIIDHLFNITGIDTYTRFLEIRANLYKACKKGKLNDVFLLTKKRINDENGFTFTINEEEKTAGILHYCSKEEVKEEIFIPRAINYKNEEYLITVIHKDSFINTEIETVIFDENSELKTIEKYAFQGAEINFITIPKHVTYIGKYAFRYCTDLIEVAFDENSEIEFIEKSAFSESSIRKLTIPSSIVGFRDGWCFDVSDLDIIEVLPIKNKENYLFFDNKFLIGKSNPQKEEMDVLVFARRDLTEVEIPSFIRIIRNFAFHKCKSLTKVVFEENSKLEVIERSAFSNTSIQKISLPDSVIQVHDTCFLDCEKLINVEFSCNSKINLIGCFAFACQQIYNESYMNPQLSFNDSYMNPQFPFNENVGFYPSYQFPNYFVPPTFDTFFMNFYSQKVESENKKKRKPKINSSSLKNLSIPSSVFDLEDGWCSQLTNLTNISIIRNDFSQNIKLIEGKMIVGKSDIYNDDFDVILFASKDIEDVVIPSNVKRIASYAFSNCTDLQKVEFSEDSQLEVIESFAFSETSIESIIIPPSVIEIEYFAFYKCDFLNEVIFPPNSELKIIGEKVFSDTSIKSITLPSNIIKLNDEWFCEISDLNTVFIVPNNKFYSYLDEKFLIGKSDPNSDLFDTILFARRDIINAIIPSFIKRISKFSFCNCNSLKEIKFLSESELELIDNSSFMCASITSITIPSSVIQIGKQAFKNCAQLQEVNFMCNSKLKIIKKSAFSDTSIRSITIPSTVSQIKKNVFCKCRLLKTVNFSNNSQLQSIGRLSFSSTIIEQILIPSSVSIIDDEAFKDCSNLKIVEFSINSSLKFIGRNAFCNTSIESITIPQYVSQIDENAFSNCTKLKTVNFSENSELCLINEFAFSNTAIEFILIPQSVTVIGDSVFSCCSKLKSIEFSENSNLKYIQSRPFNKSKIENLSIPEKFSGIRNELFYCTPHLINISIVSSRRRNYDDDDDCSSISYYDDRFIVGKSNSNEENFDVLIGARRDIKEAMIPPFIKIIASYAFEDCKQLETIDFSESKVELFESNAFKNCSIKSIEFPDETKQIGEDCFNECKSLEFVKFSENSKLRQIGFAAFYQTNIHSIFIPSHVTKIGGKAFAKCKKLEKIEFQANSELRQIEQECFKKNKVKSVSIPASVFRIEFDAFDNCNFLQIVEIEENSKLEKINPNVFYNYSFPTILMIPSSIRESLKFIDKLRNMYS